MGPRPLRADVLLVAARAAADRHPCMMRLPCMQTTNLALPTLGLGREGMLFVDEHEGAIDMNDDRQRLTDGKGGVRA